MQKFSRFILIVLIAFFAIANIHAQAQAAWAPNTAYSVGALVTYGGHTYKCLQAHTSQVGWEPPNVPALWQDMGVTTGGATATPIPPTKTNTPVSATTAPTKTNTPGSATTAPTKTNTPVSATTAPTKTNTPGSTTTCAAPYNNTTAYVNGNVVSYNGHNWTAKWWTQGEAPSTGGSGVWTDNGVCGGGTVPTNTAAPATTAPTKTNTPIGATIVPTKTNTPTGPTATSIPSGSQVLMGYFAEWGVYGRKFYPKALVTSGSASKLTHINFAFGNVTNGACAIGDSYADYDMAYTADIAVDGVADTWDAGALRGIFGQFRKLKAAYPNIKIIYSFGGWTWSGGFGAAAANAAAFANSCYSLVEDPRWADVFDGIDIDWEYPNSCGLSCDTSGFGAYKTLMAALRSRFGANYLITAATTADGSDGGKIDAADYGGAAQYVNWYNLMTYDYFGAFAAQGPTAPHSPLTSWAGIPQAGFYTDAAVQKMKSKGVPSSKLLIGIGFYGRGWTNVTQAAPGGAANGAAPGTYEAGIEDYKVLVNTCPSNGTVAGTAYAYCSPNWWSYDTPATIASKMTYKKQQGLGGAFFWEFSGDTTSGTLITAMYNNR